MIRPSLVTVLGMTLPRHLAIRAMVGRATHLFRSLAPMSIVTSCVWAACCLRNLTACASCEPAAYLHMPPLIMVAVVSPGHPSLTRRRLGLVWRSAVASWLG